MNEPNPLNKSDVAPDKQKSEALSIQNSDGSIAGGALTDLISSLPKAEQDRLKAQMASRYIELHAKQAAGNIDTSNTRKEVNEVVRAAEELDRSNARFEIKKDINTEMGKGSVQIKRDEIREKTVTFGGRRIDSRCFIATACYVDVSHPHLVLFRAYRDQVLMKHSAGRVFVKIYYKFGPYAAGFIKNCRPLRLTCTGMLDLFASKLKT